MLLMKTLLIDLIRRYQRTAPAAVRACCRFRPSCSEYMILSLDKHGVWCGGVKGVRRVMRCRHPHGGVDLP